MNTRLLLKPIRFTWAANWVLYTRWRTRARLFDSLKTHGRERGGKRRAPHRVKRHTVGWRLSQTSDRDSLFELAARVSVCFARMLNGAHETDFLGATTET